MAVLLRLVSCVLDVFTGGRPMPARITKKVFEEIERLLKFGVHTYTEISATVGVERSLVSTIAKGKHYYQVYSAPRSNRPKYLPTPEEIKAECARFRAARKNPVRSTTPRSTTPVVSPGTLD
jgi:hypothetical protein